MGETCEFIDAAREAIDQLKRLAHDFPRLSSEPVRVAIETWNEEMFRKGELIWLERERARLERSVLENRAVELIGINLVDDAIDLLNQEFSKDVDYYGLIDLVGKDRYIAALRREAIELKMNFVSPEQTADLWNGQKKPPVGGEHWHTTGVSVLMG
ncbi:MAG: hypothetical protein KZQ76_03340 [Candidatus Thiodiazotropha sp. (ex Epidulcina cf. delphinae)]|nr:hypothetical protein [Candidatus Thiodiazotropha sp. (ex Epidulcina cf. delphinae)]